MAKENHEGPCGSVLVVIEHYGLVPAVNVSVRLSGSCVHQIAVAVKSKQLCIGLYRDLVLHRQIMLNSESDMFVPYSCTNLIGDGIDLVRRCSKPHDFLLKVVQCELEDTAQSVKTSKLKLPEKCGEEECSLEFSFRIRSCSNPYAVKIEPVDSDESFTTDSSPEEIVDTTYNAGIQESKLYSLCCASCKQALSSTPVTFKKVVCLPSNWSEIAESWFCHVHDSKDVPSSPSPCSNELYVTELFYLLSKDIVSNAFCEPNSNVVKCDMCYTVIGSAKQGIEHFKGQTVQCFKDMVVFKSEHQPTVLVDALSRSRKAVYFISALIRKNMQSSFTCKFCFESKKSSSEGMCLFLWILHQKIRRFHLSKDISKTDKYEEELKTEETQKVLYNSAAQTSPLARTWLHDFSVDVYEISDSMLRSLLDALQESSETVLKSQKMLNGLYVGFLPIDNKM